MVRDSSQDGKKNSTLTAQWEMHSSVVNNLRNSFKILSQGNYLYFKILGAERVPPKKPTFHK